MHTIYIFCDLSHSISTIAGHIEAERFYKYNTTSVGAVAVIWYNQDGKLVAYYHKYAR